MMQDMLVHIVLLMLLQLDKVVVRGGGGEKMTYLVSIFLFCVVFSGDPGEQNRRCMNLYSMISGWYSYILRVCC